MEGEREGKGVYVDADGYKYEGEWLANKRHGRGRQEYRAHMKAVYTGEFVNGRESGSGRIDWENGDFYSGEFSNGLRHGVGEFACSSGDFYSGHVRFSPHMRNYEGENGELNRSSLSHFFEKLFAVGMRQSDWEGRELSGRPGGVLRGGARGGDGEAG